MKALTLSADWTPKPGFQPGRLHIEGKLTDQGSAVWRNPLAQVIDKPEPPIADDEVMIRVRACGICGSDVHMAQPDAEHYIVYPGLTAFPVVLGHEFSGEVVEVGKKAYNKRTGEVFQPGEAVTAEEMVWCGFCRACVDGYPNHCERLEELGFTIDGALAEYIRVPARLVWSLEGLRERYPEQEAFLLGSLAEPVSVSYNALFIRGGGILPGDKAVVFGGGPIGLAGVALLKRAGASVVILSEPSKRRAELGRRIGADHVIDPRGVDVAEAILELTRGEGAKVYYEASGAPEAVFSEVVKCLWRGRTLNSVIVVVGRATQAVPLAAEVFQVRRASLVGSQGHSGHGIFPHVLDLMAAGMDLTPLITSRIALSETPAFLERLRTDKEEGKVTVARF
jgi:threonine dehydrogenase-like Zn-dependent dehydrogenase